MTLFDSPFILGLLGNIAIGISIISLLFITDAIRRRTMKKMDNLIAFTVGLLIAIVMLGFIPEIIEESTMSGQTLGLLILGGMFLFYIFELFLHWHHCKDVGEGHHDNHSHEHGNNALMFTGTFLHNILHGVILFSAFSISPEFGVATTLAVLLHSIPQNIANLLMNHRDVRFAYIAAFGGVLGAVIVFPFQSAILFYKFHILALIAGALLYTALTDIFPNFRSKENLKHKISYLIFIILGVIVFGGVNALTPHDHENHEGKHHETHEFHEIHGTGYDEDMHIESGSEHDGEKHHSEESGLYGDDHDESHHDDENH